MDIATKTLACIFVSFHLVRGCSGLGCHPVLTSITTGSIENGQLLSDEGYTFIPEHFESFNETHFRVCICTVAKCMRKCCLEGQLMDFTRGCHFPDNETSYVAQDVRSYHDVPESEYGKYPIVYGSTCPQRGYPIDDPSIDTFYLMENGELNHTSVSIRNVTTNRIYSAQQFCTETNVGEDRTSNFTVVVCHVITDGKGLYRIFVLVSLPFLTATIFVHGWIPELRNLHGKNLMSYLACLTLGYICYAAPVMFVDIPKAYCQAFGMILYFSFVAAFFWLNVLSFDIWAAFSGFKGFGETTGIKIKERERRTFIFYSAYAWTGSSLMSGTVFVIDLAKFVPDTIIKPEFGVQYCWMKSSSAMKLYYFGPIAVLLFSNCLFFGLTAYELVKATMKTAVLRKEESARTSPANKQRLLVYSKIFLLMGINWIMELVAWYNPSLNVYWYLTDIINTLQGVLIFLLFVCNKRTIALLKTKISTLPFVAAKLRKNQSGPIHVKNVTTKL